MTPEPLRPICLYRSIVIVEIMWLWAAGIERFKRIRYGITTETYKIKSFVGSVPSFARLQRIYLVLAFLKMLEHAHNGDMIVRCSF